ncbi:hypothetical protein ACTJJ7_11380 [Phyllobacterium sp. 22229]|uniref:RiboL-PSP-HEPN domain-containing protein n=1 Tax=Agrobacterium radiobacter TaxID=362 RepID=A0ABD5LKL9_AGRRD
MDENKSHRVDSANLPDRFPTHRHSPQFWEELGRTVATYGFLEEVLGKAIFAFSGTTTFSDDALADALAKWQVTLEKALTDALASLIGGYEKAVKANGNLKMKNLDDLISDLRKATEVRNAICHGSWRSPNEQGASRLHFVNRKLEIFDTSVDIAFLRQLQQHVAELAVAVVNTVTIMGYQFPGSSGPGKSIW